MLREEQVWSPSHGTCAPCTAPGFCCQLKLKHLQSCLIPHCFSLRVARASFLIQAEMSYETWRKAPECALMDEAVPVNTRGGIVTAQQPLHRGTVMMVVMAARSPQADGWEISGVSRKGHEASRLPVCGSISNLICGTTGGTIWFLTFTRPGRGLYSNHPFSIIEWWTASLTSFELRKDFA